MLGVVPGVEEVFRLLVYLVISIFYVSFWLGISILFSVLFRSTASSALAALALWIFFGFLIAFGASILAGGLAPAENPQDPDQVMANAQVSKAVSLSSPVVLYAEATSTILDPFRKTTRSPVFA